MRLRLLGVVGLLALASGCSLIEGDFHECDAKRACGSGRACVKSYCVAVNCTQVVGAADAANAIVFGATLPTTLADGSTDASEVTDFNAAVLAVDEVNQRGLFGRPLVVYACDNESNVDKLKLELDYLMNAKKAVAVLTSGSSQTLAAITQALPRGVVIMTATATSQELTSVPDRVTAPGGGEVGLLWRTAPSDDIQSKVIADQLLTNPQMRPELVGLTRVGILYVDDPYGQGLANSVLQRLQAGGVLAKAIQYPRGADASAAVTQLDGFAPNLTVLVGFAADLNPILKLAATKAKLASGSGHRWWLTDSAKDPSLLADATVRAQLNGSFGTEPAQGAGPAYLTFSQRFQSRYGVDASSYSFTAHSYDAMYLLALGAAYAMGPAHDQEVTGVRLAQGLARVSSGTLYPLGPTAFVAAAAELSSGASINVDGTSGKLDFDPLTGDVTSPISIWRVKGMTFETVQTIDPTGP